MVAWPSKISTGLPKAGVCRSVGADLGLPQSHNLKSMGASHNDRWALVRNKRSMSLMLLGTQQRTTAMINRGAALVATRDKPSQINLITGLVEWPQVSYRRPLISVRIGNIISGLVGGGVLDQIVTLALHSVMAAPAAAPRVHRVPCAPEP
jgi:hypothetical protein